MKRVISIAVISTVATLPVATAWADDEDKGEQRLEAMVVTGTRTEKAVKDSPADISVITEQDLEEVYVQRFDEAIKGLPGVYIQSMGDGQPNNDVNMGMRGLPFTLRTGVYVDGQSINDAEYAAVDTSMIPIEDIKQIEVAPGPFSALYGGSAMAGVINIVTKEPSKKEVSVSTSFGSNLTWHDTAGYRDLWDFAGGGIGLSLTADYSKSNGYPNNIVTVPTGNFSPGNCPGCVTVGGGRYSSTPEGKSVYAIGDQGDTPWMSKTYGAKVYLHFLDTQKLILGYYWHDASIGISAPHSYLTDAGGAQVFSGPVYVPGLGNSNLGIYDGEGYGDYPYRNGQSSDRVTADYSARMTENVQVKLDASYMYDHFWYVAPVNPYAPGQLSDIPNARTNLNATLDAKLGDVNHLVGGFYFDASRINQHEYDLADWISNGIPGGADATYVANGYSHSYAAFAQDEFRLNDRWTFYAGAREDRWLTNGSDLQRNVDGISPFYNNYASRAEQAFNPKLAVVFNLDSDTTLRASWGKAFRAPTLVDMYVTYAATYGDYYSNPALAPERITSWELGGEHQFATQTHVRGAVFSSAVTDLINYANIPDSYNAITANTAAVHIRGVEAEATQTLLPHVQGFLNVTYCSSTVTSDPSDVGSVGKQLQYVPHEMANGGIKGEEGRVFGSLIASYTSKTYTQSDNSDTVNGVMGSFDPYTLVNLQLGYRITDAIKASFAVNNLLNRMYFEKTAYPGRTFALRLAARF